MAAFSLTSAQPFSLPWKSAPPRDRLFKLPTYWVVFLLGFVHAFPLEADPPFATGGSLHGRQLFGEANHLSLAHHGAPEARAHVHAGAHGVLGAERQLALPDGVVRLPRQLLGTHDVLPGLVQQAVPWKQAKLLFTPLFTVLFFISQFSPQSCKVVVGVRRKSGLSPLNLMTLRSNCCHCVLTPLLRGLFLAWGENEFYPGPFGLPILYARLRTHSVLFIGLDLRSEQDSRK